MGSGVLRLPQLAAGTMAAVVRLHGALHCAGAVCAPSRAACILLAVLQNRLCAGSSLLTVHVLVLSCSMLAEV